MSTTRFLVDVYFFSFAYLLKIKKKQITFHGVIQASDITLLNHVLVKFVLNPSFFFLKKVHTKFDESDADIWLL